MKKILLRISLVCMMLISFSSTTLAADWQWIVSSNTETYSFDKSSIREVRKGVYTVWVKTNYVDYVGKEIANKMRVSIPIDYILGHCEFDSGRNTFKEKYGYFYNKKGQVVKSYSHSVPYEIVPESVMERIFNATFPEYKKQFIK